MTSPHRALYPLLQIKLAGEHDHSGPSPPFTPRGAIAQILCPPAIFEFLPHGIGRTPHSHNVVAASAAKKLTLPGPE